MLRCFDLFSGIGGFSLGFERAGWSTIGFCEINAFCHRTLKKHWQDAQLFSDVRILNNDALRPYSIDVLCGGFPCQDISVAGKKAGITGSRSCLWKEFHRLINEIKPRYAIIENVANLRSNGLVTVLQDLWQIGYDAEWHCIPASALGAPHQRDRIWIIAYPNRQRCNSGRDYREERHIQSNQERINPKAHQERHGRQSGAGALCEVLANTDSSGAMVERGTDQPTASESDIGRGIIRRCREDGKFQPDAKPHETLAYPLFAGLEGYSTLFANPGPSRQIIQQSQISCFRSTRGNQQWDEEPNVPRLKDNGLNPDWVEWLMGFPVGWTQGGTRKERLRSLGNAVVPLIPEMIATSINEFERNRSLLIDNL